MAVDDLARWQGSVDTEISTLRARMHELDKAKQEDRTVIVALQVQLASLKTQVGFWAALGGIVGAGVVALVIKAIGGH